MTSDFLVDFDVSLGKPVVNKVKQVFALRHVFAILAGFEVEQEGFHYLSQVRQVCVHLRVQRA